MKIIDCFIFFREIDLLQFRLKELNDSVDYFVIVESNKTHSNLDKPFYFEENQELFKLYQDKIIYIKVEDMPNGPDNWAREKFQRQCITRGLDKLKLDHKDTIIISDLDEIMDIDTLNVIKNQKELQQIFSLTQDMYYYNLNCKAGLPWYKAKICNYGSIVNKYIGNIRDYFYTPFYLKGGWHFSYFGDAKSIITKIKSFAHQEFNEEKYINEESINKLIENCDDLFFRDNKRTHNFSFISIEQNSYLPKHYQMLLTSNDDKDFK